MTSGERWAAIEPILDELLDLAPEERAARLAELSSGDAALRAEIEVLLAEDQGREGPLDRRLAVAAVLLEDGADLPTAAGKRIGPYRVVSELGRGGMGEVLLAERADGQFEQQVALKIVRGGLNRDDIIRRFRQERTILARLRHPNIAVLHDGGIAADGVPYFAMEYVQGQPITEYCDRRTLGITERIVLFESVCRAVQYAHRNLVIHRDLKPSNVLVTADGTVKLLDFGIAKVLDPEAEDPTQATRGFLTPAYAAPEQIRGEPTSTATDVFSLGVLLYMLLAGHHPHGDTSSSVEVARAIVEEDPVEPSTVAGKSGEAARLRRAEPAELRRALRGDLDNIVAKALRKDPDDRYASVDDLRLDLERHRRSLPVSARPATARYRMRKFVRRHRVGVAAAVTATLAVAAGVAGIAWQANVAARERDRARAEAARAGAVKEYLLEVFSAADPSFDSGAALTATELVERGAAHIGSRFEREPELRAEISAVLGRVMRSLASYDRADTLLAAALADYRRLDQPQGIVEAQAAIAEVAVERGEHDRAVALLEEVRDVSAARLGADHPVTARVWSSLGAARFYQGKHAEAESAYAEALRIARSGPEPDREAICEFLLNLATSQGDRGDRATSEATTQEALAIARGLEPGGGIRTARILGGRADVLDDLDRMKEAEEAGREAIALYRREYGARGHPELAIALSNLAGVMRRAGNLDEAEAMQLEALEIFKRHLGEEHFYVARLLSNLSLTRMQRGDNASAEQLLSESLRIMTNQLGPRHRSLIGPLNNRGKVLCDLNRFEESEAVYKEALSIAQEVLGERSLDGSYSLLGLGWVCRKSGRLEEAERWCRAAWEDRRAALPAGHSAVLAARVNLAQVVAERGRRGEAREMLDGVVAEAEAGLPTTQKALDDARRELGKLGAAGEGAAASES
jgi:serine/threonine-protein kinase